MVFNSFPKDLIEAYANYKFGKVSRYFIVDGRYGTYVSLNDNNFPTKLSLFKIFIGL